MHPHPPTERPSRPELHQQLDALLPPYHHPRLNTAVKRRPRQYMTKRQWPGDSDAHQLRALARELSAQETLHGRWPSP